MKEQIKSAIHCMRANQGIGFCEECPAYAKVSKGHCVRESCRIAENSLKAWEEVLNELENMRDIIWQDTDNDARIVRANAWDKIEIINNTISIINQKLEGVQK